MTDLSANYSTTQRAGGRPPYLVLAALLAVIMIVTGGVALFLRSESGGKADTPVAAVEKYFDAVGDKDCEGMADYQTKRSWEAAMGTTDRDQAIELCKQTMKLIDDPLQYSPVDKIELKSEDGDRAVVTTSGGSREGEPVTSDIDVVKEDGSWKVDLASGAEFELGPDGEFENQT